MKTHNTIRLFAASSTLAAACLLGACGGGGQPPSDAAAPAASVAAGATAVSADVQPVAFTPEAKAGAFTQCNIEGFDQGTFTADTAAASLTAPHRITGWVGEPHAPAPAYWLRLEDKTQRRFLQVSLAPSIKRADVVAAQGNTSTMPLVSGFAQTLSAHSVPAGHYHVYIAAVDDNGTNLCDNGRTIDFK